jgi:hypothetical protein
MTILPAMMMLKSRYSSFDLLEFANGVFFLKPVAAEPKPDDVLQLHHKKNGRPRLPDPAVLDLLSRSTTKAPDSKSGNADSRSSKVRSVTSKGSGEGPKATQLGWYPSCWKSFLEHAKEECRAQHAIENPFPSLVDDLPGSITEVLMSSVVEWFQGCKQAEDGRLFFPSEFRSI